VPTTAFVLLVLLIWVATGLAAALFLARRGYRSPSWWFLGAVLGPLFIPIALERGRRQDRVVERTPAAGHGRAEADGAATVVVGVDGSPEADRSVRDAARLFGDGHARVVLVMAVDPDVVEFHDDAEHARCRALLADRAGWFSEGTSPAIEIASGQPGRVLLDVASSEGADVVVIGRRGKGLSRSILGSVAEYVTHHARTPVLLAGPKSTGAPAP
jgi:nucleotide-binding universal stress UspA family protein